MEEQLSQKHGNPLYTAFLKLQADDNINKFTFQLGEKSRKKPPYRRHEKIINLGRFGR